MVACTRLHEFLAYNPATGDLTWFVSPNGRSPVGSKVGALKPKGYRQMKVDGKFTGIHRVIWLLMTGRWPSSWIDHKDEDPSNNRWENLREATPSQNAMNKGPSKANSSGVKGVSFNHARHKWQASIRVNGRQSTLGRFSTKEQAAAVYRAAAFKYQGEFVHASTFSMPPS